MTVLCLVFFVFVQKPIFHFNTSKELKNLKVIYIYMTLSDMVLIEKNKFGNL